MNYWHPLEKQGFTSTIKQTPRKSRFHHPQVDQISRCVMFTGETCHLSESYKDVSIILKIIQFPAIAHANPGYHITATCKEPSRDRRSGDEAGCVDGFYRKHTGTKASASNSPVFSLRLVHMTVRPPADFTSLILEQVLYTFPLSGQFHFEIIVHFHRSFVHNRFCCLSSL